MTATRIQTLAHLLRTTDERILRTVPDADLLVRYLDCHDQVALEELVARHLPAVRAVCRSVLRCFHDADDAAQATFLVFLRRAARIRTRPALGAWLCRVAWRTANRLRVGNSSRAARQPAGYDLNDAPAPAAGDSPSEETTALDDEIRRLPEPYRIAVLTCYRAGVPTAEDAARLGWPKGTLLTRLAWARKRLRDRLRKRGVSLASGLAVLLADGGSGSANAVLACRIAAAGLALAAGQTAVRDLVSERVSTLTEGMVRAMVVTKMKLAVGIGLLMATLLGLGVGRMTLGSADAAPSDKKPQTSNPVSSGTAIGRNTSAARDPVLTSGAIDPVLTKDADHPNAQTEPAAVAPGNELVVRRPLGSFTREVVPYGKATVTFTENRIHVLATIRIDKVSFTASIDADYSMNRESVVYGIITGVDVPNGLDAEAAVEVMAMTSMVSDLPFSFRIRVEDDAIMVKDLKCGPLGSPLFSDGNDKKDFLEITGIICGKYKADPSPERVPTLPPAKAKKAK